MREIRFRIWDRKKKEFDTCRNGGNNLCFSLSWKNIHTLSKQGYKVYQQFTGLKDKNGKEIYEGDIIKWFADGINKLAKVIWKDCGWCAERFDKELNKFEKYYPFNQFIPVEINKNGHEDFFDGEVIGNIFENPDLLKKKELEG